MQIAITDLLKNYACVVYILVLVISAYVCPNFDIEDIYIKYKNITEIEFIGFFEQIPITYNMNPNDKFAVCFMFLLIHKLFQDFMFYLQGSKIVYSMLHSLNTMNSFSYFGQHLNISTIQYSYTKLQEQYDDNGVFNNYSDLLKRLESDVKNIPSGKVNNYFLFFIITNLKIQEVVVLLYLVCSHIIGGKIMDFSLGSSMRPLLILIQMNRLKRSLTVRTWCTYTMTMML